MAPIKNKSSVIPIVDTSAPIKNKSSLIPIVDKRIKKSEGNAQQPRCELRQTFVTGRNMFGYDVSANCHLPHESR